MSIEIHHQFKLNGIPFDKEGLKEVGYSLVKEGDSYEHPIGDFLLDWCNDSTVVSVRTSGSTGKPKHLELQKKYMVNSALATGEFFNLQPGDSVLHSLPTEFIAGKMMLVRAMVLGLEIDYVEPTSSPLDFISKTYDFCAMVPLQLSNSLGKLDKVKTLIVGGAPMSTLLREQVQNKRIRVYETYGMTETITHVAIKAINHPKENNFKTLQGVTLSTDKRNCLVIDAPQISDRPVVTNDVVNLISETEFDWLGRFDSIINSGGVKLIPEQIEAKLAKVIENRFFVAGLPDEKLGQRMVLVVEGEIDQETLFGKIKAISKLEKFEIPKRIFALPRFSETANGKILRKETLQHFD